MPRQKLSDKYFVESGRFFVPRRASISSTISISHPVSCSSTPWFAAGSPVHHRRPWVHCLFVLQQIKSLKSRQLAEEKCVDRKHNIELPARRAVSPNVDRCHEKRKPSFLTSLRHRVCTQRNRVTQIYRALRQMKCLRYTTDRRYKFHPEKLITKNSISYRARLNFIVLGD